jgi:PAS domain-containing protein
MIIIQIIMEILSILGAIFSYYRDLSVIKPLLYVQAAQMAISNYNVYTIDSNINFEGLNMLSAVFSVLFAVLNTYLASLVISDYRLKAVCTVSIFTLLEYIIIDSTFHFEDMTSHTKMSIWIAIIYTLIMIPTFGYISNSILNETLTEAKLSFQQRDSYRRMFNSLQEGVIVIDDEESITFMNELSNKVLSELSAVKNFFKGKSLSGHRIEVPPIDQKLFYLFQSDANSNIKKSSTKRKLGSHSDFSKHSSELSKQEQHEFSLRDLCTLSV